MIGKLTKGRSFRTLVKYILNPNKQAELIDSNGVMDFSNEHIIQSFEIQSDLNRNVELKVGHISLSFAQQDATKLTNELMVQIAREYLERMGIDSQYVIGRHYDKNPHCHIAFNRIDKSGKTISDSNNYKRNEIVCKELKIKYGLYFAEKKSKDINIANLREPQKTKHEIYFAVEEALSQSSSWTAFVEYLALQDIEVQFKYKSKSTDIQGVSFIKNNYIFSGSKVDTKFSYSKLDKLLDNQEVNSEMLADNKVQDAAEYNFDTFTPYIPQYKDDEYDDNISKKRNNKRKNNKTLSR